MHPAFSVLFFTVTSGFGYGFLFCLFLARLLGYWPLSETTFLICVAIATGVFTLGLLSSTQHLANPKNAWRSFVRVRTSWLSREAVLAVLGYPLFGSVLLSIYFDLPSTLTQGLILASLVWIVLLVYCTAMIYASLKTIPQWNTSLVPVCFLLFALLGGMLSLGLVVSWQVPFLKTATLAVLLLAATMKLAYFRHVGRPTRSSINTATSFSQTQVNLFDAGHSSRNFLQREFVYEVGPQTTRMGRRLAVVLVFVLPAFLIWMSDSWIAAGVALVAAYLGLLLERWLFFVEAKHVVRHYYGQ